MRCFGCLQTSNCLTRAWWSDMQEFPMFHTDDGRGRKLENLEEFDDAREVRMISYSRVQYLRSGQNIAK